MKNFSLSFLTFLIFLLSVNRAAAHVQLDYPVSGEIFTAGETVNIQWHILITHVQENWDLYFSPDGGGNWEVIQLDLDPSQLNYQWTVPEIETANAQIRIYMDNVAGDYEDVSGNFTILKIATSVDGLGENPKSFKLFANYPNPFNPTTKIRFEIPNQSRVTLKVYDVLGKEIATLLDEEKEAGTHEVEFNSRNLSNGIYFYRMKTEGFTEIKKMILIK